MTYVTNLLNRLTMYQTVLYAVLGMIASAIILGLFGVMNITWWHVAISFLLFAIFCAVSNRLLAWLYNAQPNFESQYITAGILTLIVGPFNPLTNWWVIFLISLAAMASKYVLAYNKRHIFNPAAMGVLVSGLVIGQGASWWIGNQYVLPVVLIGGFLVLKKLRWFHLAGTYTAVYFLAVAASAMWQGANLAGAWNTIQITALNSAVIFFASIMLIEPLTAPRTKRARVVYGTFIAITMVLLPIYFPTYGYGMETSLLLGNLLAFIITKNQIRQTLALKERKTVAKDTYELRFEPYKPFTFVPGQFLEWTLPHRNHDMRGIRRFFSIASSPTQKDIRLVTKAGAQMSSYKQALLAMKPGDEIAVSQLEGEFVLPDNADTKLAFIAGGIGITPFLSILQYLTDSKLHRDITLLYANKTPQDIAYQQELEQAQTAGVKTIYAVAEEAPPGWSGPTGLVDSHMINDRIPDWRERLFYISGPEPMVIAVQKTLRGMGLAGSQIKRDYFSGYTA